MYVPVDHALRACGGCGSDFKPKTKASRFCSDRCRYRQRDLNGRVPCAGCGELIMLGRGSRPPGEAMCRSCWRGLPFEHGTMLGFRGRGCRCVECVQWHRDDAREYRVRRRAEGRPLPSNGRSFWVETAKRMAIYERDNWTCQICGDPVYSLAEDPQGDWYPSLDHIVPKSQGGDNSYENLRTAHRWCNSIRGDGSAFADADFRTGVAA